MDGGSSKGLGVWFRKRHVIRIERCGAQQEEKKWWRDRCVQRFLAGKLVGNPVGKWAKITNSFFWKDERFARETMNLSPKLPRALSPKQLNISFDG